jgi:hypothetical protein
MAALIDFKETADFAEFESPKVPEWFNFVGQQAKRACCTGLQGVAFIVL